MLHAGELPHLPRLLSVLPRGSRSHAGCAGSACILCPRVAKPSCTPSLPTAAQPRAVSSIQLISRKHCCPPSAMCRACFFSLSVDEVRRVRIYPGLGILTPFFHYPVGRRRLSLPLPLFPHCTPSSAALPSLLPSQHAGLCSAFAGGVEPMNQTFYF